MASIIKVETLQDTDGNNAVGMQYVANGSAKAFVNFNGFGTVAISESLNMSSVTDNATGDYTPTLSSAMNNTNYLCVVGGQLRQRTSSIAIVTARSHRCSGVCCIN